jgi:5-oxoprolinase (ATP-hydrolysing)
MVLTAPAASFDCVIRLGMGGSATNVSHFGGEYERAFDTLVKGARMHVGPDSAGAQPGSTCYGRGRSLTISVTSLKVTGRSVATGGLQARASRTVSPPPLLIQA